MTTIEHRMQWYDSTLIEQIIDGRKTATVRPVHLAEAQDEWNTPLRIGETYTVYDIEGHPRCRIRLTGIELALWGEIPERLWRRDPATSGKTSLEAFRSDHEAFFDHPDEGFEFVAVYFERVDD